MRRHSYVVLALLAALVFGCGGSSGPTKYTISGTVTFDDERVESGFVTAVPRDGKGAPEAGPIKNGTYRLEVGPGPKRIEITATRDHPTETIQGIEPGTTEPAQEQYIPARYNTESKLEIDVTADGERTFDFELFTKPD